MCWGIFLAYIRRRPSSRLRFRVFWKAGRDKSSFSFLVHTIRKEAPSLKVETCSPKIEWTRSQITRSSWSRNHTCYPWWRRSVTATNMPQEVLHSYKWDALTRLSESKSLLTILLLFSLLFLPPSDEEEGRKHSGPSKEEAVTKLGFWWILKKLRVEDDLASPISPPFYRRMNGFIAINASLENTQALE